MLDIYDFSADAAAAFARTSSIEPQNSQQKKLNLIKFYTIMKFMQDYKENLLKLDADNSDDLISNGSKDHAHNI
jgi:hypothetical protein